MSNEQNKDSLLADQNDALGFYFDSMLLPDEEDTLENKSLNKEIQQEATQSETLPVENTPASEVSAPVEIVGTLQEEKDFLQASKLRQQAQKKLSESLSKPIAEPTHKTLDEAVSKPVQETSQTKKQNTPVSPELTVEVQTDVKKVISEGPISPKPRLKENTPDNEIVASGSKIVFSSKNDNGEVSEQVLIPRSQRLADAKNEDVTPAVVKSIPKPTPKPEMHLPPLNSELSSVKDDVFQNASSKSHFSSYQKNTETRQAKEDVSTEISTPVQMSPAAKQSYSVEKQVAASEEAPNIDLSLFLPKIKTLSEEEIAQQIEALTQAAVSQAQIESELAHVAELEQVSKKILESKSCSDEIVRNIDNAPSWAVPDFQALLFTVAGLKLAVPLSELNGIVEWGDEYINELPGHKSWYLGIIQNQGKSVPVIDTLQQVVPQNRWPANHLKEKKFKHIIMIDDARWGLACETVLEVVTLKTDSVKWRSSRTKRRWLLGTVIEHMCALLDSTEFASMLKSGDDSLMNT